MCETLVTSQDSLRTTSLREQQSYPANEMDVFHGEISALIKLIKSPINNTFYFDDIKLNYLYVIIDFTVF